MKAENTALQSLQASTDFVQSLDIDFSSTCNHLNTQSQGNACDSYQNTLAHDSTFQSNSVTPEANSEPTSQQPEEAAIASGAEQIQDGSVQIEQNTSQDTHVGLSDMKGDVKDTHQAYLTKTGLTTSLSFPLTACHTVGCLRGEIRLSVQEALQWACIFGQDGFWKLQDICDSTQNKSRKTKKTFGRLEELNLLGPIAIDERQVVTKRPFEKVEGNENERSRKRSEIKKMSENVVPQTQLKIENGFSSKTDQINEKPANDTSASNFVQPIQSGTVESIASFQTPLAAIKSALPPTALRMPDWARRFHRIVSELCKQPVCQPFANQVTSADPHYQDLANKVYPAKPISLENVLQNLEQNLYSRCNEAFNDVYTVFVCAFRYYEPGSQYWMNAQEASVMFQKMVWGEPLTDEFVPLNNEEIEKPASSVSSSGPVNQSSHVDSMLQNMIHKNRESIRKSPSVKNNTTGVAGSQSEKKKQKAKTVPKPVEARVLGSNTSVSNACQLLSSDTPINDSERTLFQDLLSHLNQDQHFELFSSFHKQAVWRTLEGGEVELDDRGTPPNVFRSMLNWCQRQLGHPELYANPPNSTQNARLNDSVFMNCEKKKPISSGTASDASINSSSDSASESD